MNIIRLLNHLTCRKETDILTEKSKYWLDLAKEDIPVAQSLLDSDHLLYAGFITHLAVEKVLKAKIEGGGESPPKIHNLIRLAEMGGVLSQMNDEQIELLKTLNPLHLEARYPSYKQQLSDMLTSDVCADMIKRAKEMIEWIEQQL